MKKAVHIFNELKFSGAELMYHSAAKSFKTHNWSIIAVSTANQIGEFSANLKAVGIESLHLPLPKFRKAYQYYKSFYKYLKSENIAVVHIHRNDLYVYGIVAFLANKKCIKTQHNVFKNRWFTRPYAILKRYVVRKFFNVQFHTIGQSVYKNELNYYKTPSVQINNWYNPFKFYPLESNTEKAAKRKELNIPIDKKVIITVGGCSHIKQHHHVIKALKKLMGKHDLHYLHLGEGADLNDEIQLSKELGIEAAISFVGNTTKVRDYLIAADLYVMSSKHEGLSISCIEAMACGLPVVLYDVPGLRDVVVPNFNGFLCSPNIDSLEKNVDHFFSSSDAFSKMGANSVKLVNKEYALELNVNKLVQLYEC